MRHCLSKYTNIAFQTSGGLRGFAQPKLASKEPTLTGGSGATVWAALASNQVHKPLDAFS